MLAAGIGIGLTCGIFHAVTYLYSRRFVMVPGQSPRQLMALAHIYMAIISLLLLPFLWTNPALGWEEAIYPLFGSTLFYFCGQMSFFQAIRYLEPSKASPLLGLKIVFIALLTVLWIGDEITTRQWAGVGLATLAGQLLRSGKGAGAVSLPGLLWILAACMGYALSDLNIGRLIVIIDPDGSPWAALFAVTLSYSLAAVFCMVMWRQVARSDREAWRSAAPFALFWYFSMITLFVTMGLLGVVFAVILQSTRGLWSIALGVLIAHLGHYHLEQKLAPATRLRQVVAAVIMCIAILLFVTS